MLGLSCGTQDLSLGHVALVAPQHVGLTRDRTGVPCIAGQILNQWTTREVPEFCLLHEARGVYFVNQECRC